MECGGLEGERLLSGGGRGKSVVFRCGLWVRSEKNESI